MVFNEVVVKNFAPIFADAAGATAHAHSLDGMSALEPVADVDVVAMLFHDVIAAKPVEIIPVAHLILHLRLAFATRTSPDTTADPIDL